MSEQHQANRRYWNYLAEEWQRLRDKDQLWKICPSQPEAAFDGRALEMIQRFVGNLAGRQVCVTGSGDNYAAFALGGMGTQVMSVDISEQQLEAAAQRAAYLGLEMQFLCADALELGQHFQTEFDLLCSSNGFFVWIAEPGQFFLAAARILKPGGFYIFYDLHPFQRPWKEPHSLEMGKSYFESGPFVEAEEGRPDLVTYEYHWTLSDLLNSMAEAGLILRQIAESPPRDSRFWQDHSYLPGSDERLLDWKKNPRAGLPTWLTAAAQKPSAC
jgi:SAM-dependent methyltransferase